MLVLATHPDVARSILTRPQDFIKSNPPLKPGEQRLIDPLNRDKECKIANLVSNNGRPRPQPGLARGRGRNDRLGKMY